MAPDIKYIADHISSYPYISPYTYRTHCHHGLLDVAAGATEFVLNLNPENTLDPHEVKENDRIYIVTELVPEFYNTIHPDIKNQYHLVIGNSDMSVDNSYAALFQDKVLSISASNMIADCDERFQALPIGIESRHLYYYGYPTCEPSAFQILRDANLEKTGGVLLSFRMYSNYGAREPMIKYFQQFEDEPWFTMRRFGNEQRVNIDFANEYLEVLCRHKFVLSPFGRGFDCHRTWEAWYLGSFPIILRHPAYREWMDIPAWWIDDWSEVQPELIDKKYEELCQQPFPAEKLTFDYWNKKIGGSDPIPAGSNV